MDYQPAVPLSGIAGWEFLSRTRARQGESFAASADIRRETAYFRDRIATIGSARDLVADRQLLKVALGAFGLADDLDKRFFIRKVLEEGATDPKAMANRLVDRRYRELAAAFGFGSPLGPRTSEPGFGLDITRAYERRSFEIAVGRRDESLRLALGFEREIAAIAAADRGDDTAWLKILGTPPLRRVVEQAFGLPREFAGLDLDRQVATLRDRAARLFGAGDVAQFTDSDKVSRLIQRFLAREGAGATSPGSSGAANALTLLQGAGGGGALGSGTLESLFAALY